MDSQLDTLSHMTSESPMLKLPNEILYHLFTFFPYTDLCQLRLVCQRFSTVVLTPQFIDNTKLVITRKNVNEIQELARSSVQEEIWYFHHSKISNEVIMEENMHQLMSVIGRHIKSIELCVASDIDILKYLPNLQELNLVFNTCTDFGTINLKHLPSSIKSLTIHDYKQNFILEQLIQAEAPLNLEVFDISGIEEKGALLLQVLNTHKHTLKELHLTNASQMQISASAWQTLVEQMNKLEKIEFVGNCTPDLIYHIVNYLPSTAPIKHISLQGIIKFNDELLTCIAEKWSTTIKRLDLITTGWYGQLNLSGLSSLRNMSILDLNGSRKVNGDALIKGICSQANYELHHLSLNSLEKLNEETLIILVKRLPNLRILDLSNCQSGVTDNTLAKIFQHLLQLRHLFLDNCNRITDKGLLGFGEQPYPISRLKCLTKLDLCGCYALSNLTLSKALKFPELRWLSLGSSRKISTNGFKGLVKNCPTLENIIVAGCAKVNDKHVKAITLDLKRLRTLSLNNCT